MIYEDESEESTSSGWKSKYKNHDLPGEPWDNQRGKAQEQGWVGTRV